MKFEYANPVKNRIVHFDVPKHLLSKKYLMDKAAQWHVNLVSADNKV